MVRQHDGVRRFVVTWYRDAARKERAGVEFYSDAATPDQALDHAQEHNPGPFFGGLVRSVDPDQWLDL